MISTPSTGWYDIHLIGLRNSKAFKDRIDIAWWIFCQVAYRINPIWGVFYEFDPWSTFADVGAPRRWGSFAMGRMRQGLMIIRVNMVMGPSMGYYDGILSCSQVTATSLKIWHPWVKSTGNRSSNELQRFESKIKQHNDSDSKHGCQVTRSVGSGPKLLLQDNTLNDMK